MSMRVEERGRNGGDAFGPYRTIRKVGEGASSIVFEAMREGDDFAQRVAVKLLLEGGEARLSSRETRILARLDHPSIARLLDAGTTRGGSGFLVTEFVDGEPCTVFAEKKGLPQRARLRLFLEICEAVQFANRRLVIHCDIKPGNVLVQHDGKVKLLDFGISRLLSETADEGQTRARFYSPNYASPEQIQGKPLGVGTDVYSLGALLCELLAGRPPQAGGGETRVELAGDLGTIARKALDPAVEKRYGSVADLAADVTRFLEGRPIEARPASGWERWCKFVARHRWGTGLTLLSLAALGASAWYALRQQATAEERFAQIRALANSVLFEIYDELEKSPGSLAARHVLTEQGVRYLDGLAAGAEGNAQLQLEAARGTLRLADIEGVGNEPNLGRVKQARERLLRAESKVRAVRNTSPSDAEAVRVHAKIQEALATSYIQEANPQSVAMAHEYLKSAERLKELAPSDEKAQEEHAYAMGVVANSFTQSKTEFARGVEAWKRAVEAWKALAAAQPESIVRKRELARGYQFYAGALVREVRREEAREAALAAYRMHKELASKDPEGEEHMLSADVGLLANLNAQLKRYQEAIPLFQEQLELRERALTRNPGNVTAEMGAAGTMNRIGLVYVRMGQVKEGLSYLERAMERQRQVYKKVPDNVLVNREMLYGLTDLAEANHLLNRRERVCSYTREGMGILSGPMSKSRETPTDAAKKKLLQGFAQSCRL